MVEKVDANDINFDLMNPEQDDLKANEREDDNILAAVDDSTNPVMGQQADTRNDDVTANESELKVDDFQFNVGGAK